MDFKTTSIIALGFLLALLALSTLALAADNMAYAHSHANSELQIHYLRWNATAEAQYSYWLEMDYTPSRFTLSREAAMIASGVICTIAGAVAVTTACFVRKEKVKACGLSLWLVSLVFAAVGFAAALAGAVYAWYPVMQWNINFLKSLPVPSKVSGAEKTITYRAPFAFTPEVWNCYLAPYVAGSESGRLQSLCNEAKAAKSLTIPVVILAAALFGIAAWSWWTAVSTAVVEPKAEGKDVEEVSVASKE
ncbi:uncharacterized protein LTR77_003505 [Saxophila tyrrhenica]|uniref:Uncharacterized protein n=1 Tax=Saxophila tyrrhenica TaxID=1690608 RepID=A0AAV9PH89_9PEZI|nr:hypothetical protein LTR77_003505 [Saxophila tyrrhenica]